MASLEIEVDVNEAYIQRVFPGQRVAATLEAYPEWKIPAAVIAIIPTADRQKATVRVRIGFDQLDPRILPDMGVRVAFQRAADTAQASPQGVAQGIRVPSTALLAENAGHILYVVEGNVAQQRTVTLGPDKGAMRQVLSGLNAGENYVVDVPDELYDGARVKIN